MQDKEFDQLFRDRFEEAEITPSANLWNHIDEELNVKRKRVFPFYRAAAAVVLITAATGLLWKNQSAKLQLKTAVTRVKDTAVTHPDRTVSEQVAVKSQHIAVYPHAADRKNSGPVQVAGNIPAEAPVESKVMVSSYEEKKDLLAMQPSAVIAHPDHKDLVLKNEVPKQSLPQQPVTALAKVEEAPAEEVVLASADLHKEENENRQSEGRRIRNVGDLVNYVVDKVDKREEKFIQFKTDDDDNSSLVSLNIGMFRFNQKKHK